MLVALKTKTKQNKTKLNPRKTRKTRKMTYIETHFQIQKKHSSKIQKQFSV